MPVTAQARSVGNRIELLFQRLKLVIFEGGIAYTFYPGSRLIYQEAVVSTQEPDTAYLYDTVLCLAAPASGMRPGLRKVISPVTAMSCDFHGDGHPRDLTDLRLLELDDY